MRTWIVRDSDSSFNVARGTTVMQLQEITMGTVPVEAQGRNWGRTALIYSLAFGAAIAFTVAFAPGAHAAPFVEGTPDPSTWVTTAIDFLKKLWGFVFVAQIVALLTYVVAFFTQSWFPSFFQAFQGDWIKKAALISVLAHPVMGFLVAGADTAKSGFGG